MLYTLQANDGMSSSARISVGFQSCNDTWKDYPRRVDDDGNLPWIGPKVVD